MKMMTVLACGALLLAPLVYAQDGTTSTVFVPKKGADQVPIEIVFPLKERKDAHAKAMALRRMIERDLRPARDGDSLFYRGKCIIEPHQLEIGDAVLRVECWSFAQWRDDQPLVVLGAPETPEEVMALIGQFLAKHRERLARPAPRPAPPPRSQMARMT